MSRPLDYEQIPNGLIYLTVMAKDAGHPPLNSTVPITIEVFVSTQGAHWPCLSRIWGDECFPALGALPEPCVPTSFLSCPHNSDGPLAAQLSQGRRRPGPQEEPDGPVLTSSRGLRTPSKEEQELERQQGGNAMGFFLYNHIP